MKSWIYFARHGVDGPIKIGRADNPRRRVMDPNVATPVELLLLGTMTSDDADPEEDALHQRLKEHRVRGEWFEAPAVLDEMRQLGSRLVSSAVAKSFQIENAWARTTHVRVRVTPEKFARWQAAAREQNKPLSAWLCDLLNLIAEEEASAEASS